MQKDTCNICDTLKMKQENEPNLEKKDELKEIHNNHLELAENAQNLRREDFLRAKEDKNFECLTFDLQKTLPLPRIPTNIVFYKRQLWVYNAGIHSGKDDKGYCYVWVEGVAGRGSQEIGSCLIKHIKTHLSPDVHHLALWCDSCGGQNRNIKLTLILESILHSTQQLETITIKFLCSGHSFLPNDSDFSDIECALKTVQRLYTPGDYISIMESCRKRKPFIVTEMSHKDFFGVANLEKSITNRKTATNGEKINWLKIRSIRIEKKDPFILKIKQNDFASPEETVNIKKSVRGKSSVNPGDVFSDLVELWPNGKPVAEAKLQNLRELFHLIPQDAMEFYNNLVGDPSITEDVDGYNVAELDFEIEAE